MPPPLIPAGALLAALLLHWLVPLGVGFRLPLVGALLVVTAVGLLTWSAMALRAANTSIRPDRPTSAIVADGPYGLSRNPIYLAMALCSFGIALAWGSVWGWLAALAVPIALQTVVIRREEVYLSGRFGAEYAGYRRLVRRWM